MAIYKNFVAEQLKALSMLLPQIKSLFLRSVTTFILYLTFMITYKNFFVENQMIFPQIIGNF